MRTAKASYDRMSRWYDLLTLGERRCRDLGLKRLNVARGERALEIGFGTGHGVVALAASAGPAGRVYGIDVSAGMLRAAVKRAAVAGVRDRVELVLGDAASLPYRDDAFDAIFMCFALELFEPPKMAAVLGECRRALRGGGRIGVVSLSRGGGGQRIVGLYEWMHRKFPAHVDCRPIHVADTLGEAGLNVGSVEAVHIFGLPVEIVLAYEL